MNGWKQSDDGFSPSVAESVATMPHAATYDLVIVGMGPVGATAAALAGRRGINTLVLERSAEVWAQPRAIVLDHDVMRIFQSIGITEKIQAHLRAYRPTEYRGARGEVIKRFDARPAPYRLGWSPNYSFSQPPVEREIRKAADECSSVRTLYGAEVEGVAVHADAAEVRYRDARGSYHSVSSQYVLACDGGASRIRSACSLKLDSLDFDESWLVVDGIVDEAAASALPDINIQYCEPDRPCTYVVGPGKHRRWEFKLHETESAADAAEPAFIRQLLARWVAPESIDLWRSAAYRFHALVLSRWSVGRLFFVGDAAHMTPPFLAQGMCQGIRDAANLVWKLDWVMRDRAGDPLLATYERERLPHVRRTTEIAKELGRLICERDPQRAAERDARLLGEHDGAVPVTLRQDLLPPLEGGLIDSTSVRSERVRGQVCPQPVLASSQGEKALLDDIAGSDLRLIVHQTADMPDITNVQVLRDLAPGLQVLIVRPQDSLAPGHGEVYRDVDNVLIDWMKEHDTRALLVRPDHYVYGGDNSVDGVIDLCRRFARQIRSGAESHAR